MTTAKDFSLENKRVKNDTTGKDWKSATDVKHCQNELSHTSTWLNPNRRFLRNPFNQPNLFQNSMIVCFVCGNVAREENVTKLYSRNARSEINCPFFPFLEYHDPAPGADSMKEDWSVLSCSVCSALLTQQWKSFEKGRMPINKRLYWLKRPSGCEIRQPVSQIELEEILNEHSKENNVDREETDSEEEIEEPMQKKSQIDSPIKQTTDENQENMVTVSSTLDFSTGVEDRDTVSGSSPFICYSCGIKGSMPCSIFPVHCKPSYEQMRAGVPFYPTVLQESQAPGSTVIYDSVTFLCMNCLPKHKTEWHFMQQNFLEKDPTKTALPRIPVPELVSCYTCGSSVSTKFNDGIIHTLTSGKKNKMCKKLYSQKELHGAVSLTFGFTYLCKKCKPLIINEHNDSNFEVESDQESEKGHK